MEVNNLIFDLKKHTEKRNKMHACPYMSPLWLCNVSRAMERATRYGYRTGQLILRFHEHQGTEQNRTDDNRKHGKNNFILCIFSLNFRVVKII